MDFASKPPSSPFTPRLPHPPLPPLTTTNTLGILSSHLLPSLAVHTTLSLAAYSAGRFTNRLDAKDLLWPSAFVVNAWYHGVVSPYMVGRAKGGVWECIRDMGYAQRLLLGGVTVWGIRLFDKVFWRIKGRCGDDGRYQRYRDEVRKRKEGELLDTVEKGELAAATEEQKGVDDGEVEREMWNKAFLGIFLPEAVVQSFVSLGWTAVRYSGPINAVGTLDERWRKMVHGIAVAMFTAGLALEAIADSQLQRGRRRREEGGLVRDGVWSIVRHPNYLGDFLVHLSFPLMALADGVFNPAMFLGPVCNYVFLRFVAGDKENDRYQMDKYARESPSKYEELLEWKAQKNSFWPGWREVANGWTWAVVGIGAVAAGAEWAATRYL
ncbi:hypothetical protein H072_2512 [Dactylellina haptotyla CBS 200.50]|uniref:Steroid 5-alpha reductase C-terminal domain-containing protein n=1 Tax=Dactylellina haptotyla (strain CBS 200.50) TaxID=1284197 RepID=S8AQW6_DACHA|nr:hypothetical protein H072_2512 [Dactylellina haptotyla CBS 200.50]